MDISSAHSSLADHLDIDVGRFYGSASGLHLGAGQIYDEIRFPALNTDSKRFSTLEGLVYVLTHECDVDSNNERPFNEFVLVCPIIEFEQLVIGFSTIYDESYFTSFLARIGRREVSRVIYLPQVSQTILPYGGLLYFNQITHTHRDFFDDAKRKVSLTGYGLTKIDHALQHHLLRPKDEPLPMSGSR